MSKPSSRVAVIAGGPSSEAAVSHASARGIQQALQKENFFAEILELDSALPERLLKGEFDVAFPIAHGALGEDGCLQGLLEVLGVPYIGSGVLASAISAHKPAAKRCFREANLPLAPECVISEALYHRLERERGSAAVLALLQEKFSTKKKASALDLPGLVVKPASGGSAIGVQRLPAQTEGSQVLAALRACFAVDPEALVEAWVSGLEVTCGVLEAGEQLVALPPTLIHAKAAEWYDFTSRYGTSGSLHECPAPLPAERLERIQQVALAAFRAVGARDLARMDFVVPEDLGEDIVLLEVNTLPGMTATSLYPEAAEAAGYPFPRLCKLLVEQALARPKRSFSGAIPLPG